MALQQKVKKRIKVNMKTSRKYEEENKKKGRIINKRT